jgi:thiol-disulfide isomerase/thioredoxin
LRTARQILLAGAFAGIAFTSSAVTADGEAKPTELATARSVSDTVVFHGATGWINTPPLVESAVHGKVIVVEFWTYTCINWRRTLPYVRAWAERYKDHGLVVIGVHTPEFSFEKDLDYVRRATAALEIP